MKQILIFTLLISFAFVSKSETKGKIEVPLRFDRYYNYDEVNEALKALNKAYPELTKLEVVGKSEEGREIYALTINNSKTGDASAKPGVYVDGNIHGNEIQAGEVCLYYANMLLTKYGENEKVTKVVDRNAHYILPVVNVDGRYHFFADAHTPSSSRSIRVPKDDDNDGLFDEDAPDDLDGDGSITQMRIKDPNGSYKADPDDPRILVRVEPGKKGEYTLLGSEGIDNDNDGRLNEDAEGYLDPNRDWGNNWMPRYVQSGAGNFPFSGVGIKAVSEYIMNRPNIIVAFSFHNNGGMWLRVPSDKSINIDPSDIAAYDVIGKNAIKITPGYVYQASLDLYPTYGDSDGQLFFNYGIYSFVGELFQQESETYREKTDKPEQKAEESGRRGSNPDEAREQLKFNDHLAQGEMYKEWKTYNHPTYGEIEIGGWVKMTSRLPQIFMLQELVHRNASVVFLAAENTPEISMEVFEVKEIGKNLSQVRVRLKNKNGLPTMTTDSYKNKLFTPDMLKVTGAKVVAGGKISDFRLNKVSYKEDKPEIQFLSIPSYGTVEYQFLIEGKGEISISYESRKANDVKTFVKL
ncbi:MAG TPA: M14 family metallopeptidase [Draconibacterium sp.]|nr:M14 family metallopeptidase [Draconibacterium sp.]